MPLPLNIEAAAAALRQAQQQQQPIDPIKARFAPEQQGIDTAYAIQEANTQAAIAAGGRLVGRKIGLTSPKVQQQLGVGEPDFGMLFADMAVGQGMPVSLQSLILPKVEAEIALVIGQDLTHERHTYADIINATEYALPAIEIVDSRIADWRIALFDTVADNASSARFVLGSRPILLRDVDLTDCAMQMTDQNGTVVATGEGRQCLYNPLNAAIWLADMMVQCGRPLLAGDIVLTGALGPMVAVTAANRFTVNIANLGHVDTEFVA
ncbi:MAG: fumarylacetoacetate hydrolase family protein [Neisseriaceae bacterium]|nr:fumarylacetoacetate hydrolase family protein [Neisseriaceae bacterium]MBP6862728.1 fumarylacetoacetate hydrolase family protein [Neisseriaceae bacterium]